jgi:GxxExxY protein
MEKRSSWRRHMDPAASIRNEPRLRHVPDAWNAVTERIIGCAIEVHRTLGPGFLERLYEDAMAFELGAAGLAFIRQHPIRVRYKSILLSEQRLDLVVENLVVVELKSVEAVPDAHLAALVSYLRAADLPLGLLINFNVLQLSKGVYRRLHNGCSRFDAGGPGLPPPSSASSAF